MKLRTTFIKHIMNDASLLQSYLFALPCSNLHSFRRLLPYSSPHRHCMKLVHPKITDSLIAVQFFGLRFTNYHWPARNCPSDILCSCISITNSISFTSASSSVEVYVLDFSLVISYSLVSVLVSLSLLLASLDWMYLMVIGLE
jgi:hypothetical protein